ncbi:MAG: hypothetical protein AAF696_39345 [Bacteroidota bacterium]
MNFVEKALSYLKEDQIEQCLRLTFSILDQIIERKKKETSQEDPFNLDLINLKEVKARLILISARVSRAKESLHNGTIDFSTDAMERNLAIEAILNNLEIIDKQRNATDPFQETIVEIKDIEVLNKQLEKLISLL